MFGTAESRQVEAIVEAVRPLLSGFSPDIQGAVLADLTAMWLAGHVGPGARALREELLEIHVKMIHDLIEPNEKQILARCQSQGRG